MVPRDADGAREGVVEEGERDLVLCTDGLANDDLVDVVELVPVLVGCVHVAVERLELGPAGNGHVEGLSGEEGVEVKEVKVVLVAQVREQLVREAVERAHHRQRQTPLAVGRTVDELGVLQRLVIVEPLIYGCILLLIQLHLNRLQRLHIHNVVAVVERRLLIVERRESHTFEVPAVALLASHHDPHGAPLRDVDWLDHPRDFVHKGDGAGDMVQDGDLANLFPRHRHVLQELEDGVGYIFERAKVDALVVTVLFTRHVAVVFNDLANMLRRHVRFFVLDEA
ncbi:hypothetical protein BC936DRAFT_137165 [Jimgerdemannia flammicorona]|uniref:Uncharacterized protein n=1 Tax=Jimgerdemannia flammicorona TaxID=994334 RepID=A0A433DJC2_9FUNG|nr:hypothetical protein BC936DRAFT_137165 [Jimgerdemannia flammicorona]